MSSKTLPDHFAKSAASFCANQLTSTSAVTPTLYASKWCNRPGFLDPFEVVHMCVRRLQQATYINVRYARRNDERIADKTRLCPGLEVYFQELVQDPQVQQDLAEHISRGSMSHLKFVIGKYKLSQVLLFLLKYIRERGPMLRIHYTSLTCLQQACSRSNTLAIAFLTSGYQHEFEHESVVAIGSYLSYLLTVACAHDLFWMQTFLAELWGPLLVDFVNIGSHLSETMSEEQLCERRVCFMSRLLESMPWDSLKRCESLRLTLGPDQERQELLPHGVEVDRQIALMQERPPASPETLMGNAGNILAFLDSQLPDQTRKSRNVNEEYMEAVNEKLLRDEMLLQEEQKLRAAMETANMDYSDQYMYSAKHRALHAPYGMCPSGV